MKPLKSLFAIYYLICSGILWTQSYSITNVLQISPPYSSYIPDYIDPFNTQFTSILTLNDNYEPQHQVKLKISFEGDGYYIETSPYASLPPITLTPNLPVVLSGQDLSPYLSIENLSFSGMDPNYYQTHKSLPEGPCKVCVEVIDYNNPYQVILGNLNCQFIWFSLYDPPIINLPFCGDVVPKSTPQFLQFNWTPLHVDLDLFQPTIYQFELFEIRPEGMDPNAIVQSTLPYFTTTTNQPFLLYSMTDPPLRDGQWYAWRIQAIDPQGRARFKNQGYSEVCSFQYGSPVQDMLDQVQISLNSQGVSPRRGSAWWNFDPNLDQYEVEYRRIGGAHWFPINTEDNTLALNNLEPETSYEVRVRGQIGDYFSDWSNVSTFQTDALPTYACNSTIFPPIPPNFIPLNQLRKNDRVQIGQFEMQIKEANTTGSPGHFRGLGTIQVPFILLTLRVSFEDILVDQEYTVRQGEVLAITKGLDSWIEENEINDAPVKEIDGTIEDIEVADSVIIIYLEDDTLQFNFENEPIVFVDENGIQYAVYKDGRILTEDAYSISYDHLSASANFQIQFENANEQTFGFDGYLEHYFPKENYEMIRLEDQSLYIVPYKSISKNGTDQVIAQLICDTCQQDQVSFKTLDGEVFESNILANNKFHIQLSALQNNTSIYAFYSNLEIGKLNIEVFPEKVKALHIVNLTDQILNQNAIREEIEHTFFQANIRWEIQWSDWSPPNTILGEDQLLETPNTTLMHKYSEEMRTLRNAFFEAHPEAPKSMYYIFVAPGFSDNQTQGYMVRGRTIGFVVANANERTYAHELGHGAGGLEHSFPEITQGSTKNLMDYATQSHLTKKQWQALRLPIVLNWLDDEEDGAYQEEDVISYFENQEIWRSANSNTAYPLIDGTILKINGVTEVLFEKYGRVTQFKIGSEHYQAYYLKYITTSTGDWNWVSTGYFNTTDYQFTQENNWTQEKQEFANEHRFKDFLGTVANDSIASFGLKKFEGQYFNCYCLHYGSIESPTTTQNYFNATSLGNWILTEPILPDNIQLSECTGNECLDLSQFNLPEGKGTDIFHLLANKCPTSQLNDFFELAQYINEESDGIAIGFYTEIEQQSKFYDYYLDRVFEDQLTQFFEENEIYSIERFQYFFPIFSNGDEVVTKLFSSHNLWEFLEETPGYNLNSFDLTSFDYNQIHNYDFNSIQHILDIADYLEDLLNYQIETQPENIAWHTKNDIRTYIDRMRSQPDTIMYHKLHNRSNVLAILKYLGVFDLYEYDMLDLLMRRQIQTGGGVLYTTIRNHEQAGEAVPLHSINEYDQYVQRYGTESAFYLGFQYMKNYVESLWEPEVAAVAISKFQRIFNSYKGARNSGRIRRFEDVINGTPYSSFDNTLEITNSFKNETGITISPSTDDVLLNEVRSWQGTGNYPGVDDWIIVDIPENTIVLGGIPGQSEFYSVQVTLENANYIKQKYWNSLQVSPHPQFGFRSKLGEYKIIRPIKVAISRTLANPLHGQGGAWQIYISNFEENLNFIKEIELH
ncbi:MAG: fibronectin type III domain-containing protein [Crocinitomicaceae bacterium]